ncbi:uncharacterized protein LOC131242850 isoform X2 [Magnolia sinica]|uniref:uncharacterized protein LOC131242850 isoform X2 n=1 Tax=Magnolia sinica TaxID=86752 RepID=UPI00265B5C8D|nr:uncharacterized protein LOC131242850 isoform X2 [Magnolia sinica]
MRLKKKKNQRKSVRFYRACFGFREPFKILCDGTFIHHLLRHSIPLSQLSKLLSSSTKVFVTKCIVGELRSLGDSHSDSVKTACTLLTARCDHERRRKSAASCIESVIGGNNSEHFFVATQDTDLRMKLKEIPGVPVIYGLKNSLFLEPPSDRQRQFVTSTEEERLHISEPEYNMLKKRVGIQVTTESSDSGESFENETVIKQAVTKTNNTGRMLGVADTCKFKRKKAKDGEVSSASKRKRNRKRKKGQMERKLAEVKLVEAG